ncbi:MAG: hypothetical protein ABFS17_02635 [Chloroflexota bacterium]
MGVLQQLTYLLNLLALTLGIWLGFYVVSHSPRRLVSWLTGFSLWSISGFFLNMLMAITPPPIPDTIQTWQIVLFPFWSPEVFATGMGGWLNGWLATPAVAFWHHITVLLREKKPSSWKIVQIVAVYLIAAVAIYVQLNTSLMFTEAAGDPLQLNYLRPGIYYSVFMSLLTVLAGICIYNLVIAAKSAPSPIIRKQFTSLAVATCLAGGTGPVSLLVLVDEISIPRAINTVLLAGTILMIGYSIARYSALIEGRLIRRDLIYNASVTVAILIVYLLFTWIAIRLFHIPSSSYIFVAILAIISHSLVDFARRYLEKIFFRKEERQLRTELQKLTQLNGSQQLAETLEIMLHSICTTIRATYGTIFLFEGNHSHLASSFNWNNKSNPNTARLKADDMLQLQPNHLLQSLSDAALLVPLYEEPDQIGAVIVGCPVNGVEYPQEDQELLLEACDLIAETISNIHVQGELISEATQLIQAIHTSPVSVSTEISPKTIEDLLRNVLDYAYLGNSDFAQRWIVQQMLPEEANTHIDRGKSVYQLLESVVDKLRPADQPSRDPPPREWHPYLILQWAYFEDRLNREIMAALYISEGTFNRTRRAALRSVARALEEMQ